MALLPLGQLESLALAGESYKLALTPGLIAKTYGGKVTDLMLEEEGRYVHSEGDTNWWVSSGRGFLSPGTDDDPASELAHAKDHFFLPRRIRDPFHRQDFETESPVTYDAHDLLIAESRDALDNIVATRNDYRVLQPSLLTDPNGNRSEVAFDISVWLWARQSWGKICRPRSKEIAGRLRGRPDRGPLSSITGRSTGRPARHPAACHHAAGLRPVRLPSNERPDGPQPTVAYALARETHDSDLAVNRANQDPAFFVYSDGFGREIQKKIQAEPGPLVEVDRT